jgi:hypothetical protein
MGHFGKGSETESKNTPELLYHVHIFLRVRENATGALQTSRSCLRRSIIHSSGSETVLI